jgi:hypothetical protein
MAVYAAFALSIHDRPDKLQFSLFIFFCYAYLGTTYLFFL